MPKKYRVGILGATGTVGQRFIQLLENHPQFEITALAASDRSAGKPFAEACAWKLSGEIPEKIRSVNVDPIEPPLDCDIVFSSLPSTVARETEEAFSRADSSRFRFRRISEYQRAQTRPKDVGSACTPCVRPICGVSLNSKARLLRTSSKASIFPSKISQASRSKSALAVSTTSLDVNP